MCEFIDSLSSIKTPRFCKRTAAKHATSAKTKGASLNFSQRVKLYCLAEEKSQVEKKVQHQGNEGSPRER